MTIQIRAARLDEVPSLLGMYDWLFEPPGRRPPGWGGDRPAAALKEAIEGERSAVLVAEDEQGGLAGLCCPYLDVHSVRFGQRCWVEDLVVRADRRSEGIGDGLLAAARDWAMANGATHIELDTGEAQLDAQRFYERQGEAHRGISYSWALR